MADTTGHDRAEQLAYTDDEAALIAVVLGGVEPFRLYAALKGGDGHDRAWDLLEDAQALAVGNEKLTAAVAVLIDAFWPPVAAEDVFDVDLYGVTEDYDLVEVSR